MANRAGIAVAFLLVTLVLLAGCAQEAPAPAPAQDVETSQEEPSANNTGYPPTGGVPLVRESKGGG